MSEPCMRGVELEHEGMGLECERAELERGDVVG